jgi:DNA-binding NtrC family response regulator
MGRDMYGNILVVDDDRDVLQAARLLLKDKARAVRTTPEPEAIPKLMDQEHWDVILLDMNFAQGVSSGAEGFRWLDRILEIDPSAVVILITAFGDVDLAVRAIKEGATDFVQKPWHNEKLLATLSAATKLRESRREASRLREGRRRLSEDLGQEFREVIGQSPPMQEVFAQVRKVAPTDANVLLLGENGTGKELIARAIHRHSDRSEEVFVSVDMGAMSESLFESELFGHVKGAFTDAKEDRTGRFEIASGGTLFLDEIGNVPLDLQPKLLRAIQQREITRVGESKPRPVDIRLISATNRPIYEEAGEQFRKDLLYRINTVEIRLPPLRERTGDIPLLVEHFIDRYRQNYDRNLQGVNPAVLAKMKKYHWPGNVRELEHMVERAVIMSDRKTLQPEDFFFADTRTTATNEGLELEDYDLASVESRVIQRVLDDCDGNISQAAEELGISRAALYRRMDKYDL